MLLLLLTLLGGEIGIINADGNKVAKDGGGCSGVESAKSFSKHPDPDPDPEPSRCRILQEYRGDIEAETGYEALYHGLEGDECVCKL